VNPVEQLRQEFYQRHAKNPGYSLRAFARDLGVSPGQLSRLLAGSRRLTPVQRLKIAQALGWKIAAIQKNTTVRKTKLGRELSLDAFEWISDWRCYAVLMYLQTPRAGRLGGTEPKAIAAGLSLSIHQVREVLEKLDRIGLIRRSESGRWVEAIGPHRVTTKRSLPAVRLHHEQMMQRAIRALKDPSQGAFLRRMITGQTVSLSTSSFQKICKKVSELQRLIVQLSVADQKSGTNEEVYQINVQVFPHSNSIESVSGKEET
jgi:uncharacterized protein (TIGR02147 family)